MASGTSVSLSGVGQRLADGFARRVAIDRRALAALRVALGALLLTDLALRSRDLVAFYTDAGVLPRSALYADYGTIYSLHALSGAAWAQVVLFVLAGVFALAMLVGYRTRLATAVSWLLLVSLHLRNPMVLNAGDSLLRMLVFWSIFLPIGDRYAVDATRGDEADAKAGSSSASDSVVATIATLALLLQVVLVYSTNAIHKLDSEEWMSGKAVSYVLQADHYTILLGDVLSGHTALLEVFTYLWVVLLFASPLLIALRGIPRAILASLFVGMHLGMVVTIAIDVFPLVSVAGLIPFYPPVFWDTLESLAERTGLKDAADSLADDAPALVAGSAVGSVFAASGRNAWRGDVNEERSGMVSGLGIAALPDKTDVAAAADGLARARSVLLTVVPYVFLVLVVTSNAASVGYATMPDAGNDALDAIHGDQDWGMFAPDPIRTTRWVAAPGTLADGSEVDVFHRSRVDLARPERPERSFPNARWRKYLVGVWFADNENHRSYLANYLCDRSNRQADTRVETVRVVGLWEYEHPYDGSVDAGETEIVSYDCSGPLVQNDE